jgi:hypothetical protein
MNTCLACGKQFETWCDEDNFCRSCSVLSPEELAELWQDRVRKSAEAYKRGVDNASSDPSK